MPDQANTSVIMAVFSSFIACNLYTAAFVPNRKKNDRSSEEDELEAAALATIVPNRIGDIPSFFKACMSFRKTVPHPLATPRVCWTWNGVWLRACEPCC